jgi:hypothetical protein
MRQAWRNGSSRPLIECALVALWLAVVASGGLRVSALAQEPVQAKRMAADAHPVFEVAAIKHSDPNNRNEGYYMDGRHFNIENLTVQS